MDSEMTLKAMPKMTLRLKAITKVLMREVCRSHEHREQRQELSNAEQCMRSTILRLRRESERGIIMRRSQKMSLTDISAVIHRA
jgi:hypothetical protein